MKLYNLYQSVILEEIIRLTQLNEAVSTSDVDNILNGDPNKQGKFYYVSFKYQSKDGEVSNRWVQVTQRNVSTADNGLIDAYQVSKNGKSSSPSNEAHSATGWKKFDLNRMSDIKVSKVPFYQEPKPYTSGYRADGTPIIARFNKTGNNSPSVKSTEKIAALGSYQYADSTIANKERQKQKAEKDTQARLQQQKQNFGDRQQAVQQQQQQDKEKKELQKVEFDKFKERQQQKQLQQKQIQEPQEPQDGDIENNDIENKDELNNA